MTLTGGERSRLLPFVIVSLRIFLYFDRFHRFHGFLGCHCFPVISQFRTGPSSDPKVTNDVLLRRNQLFISSGTSCPRCFASPMQTSNTSTGQSTAMHRARVIPLRSTAISSARSRVLHVCCIPRPFAALLILAVVSVMLMVHNVARKICRIPRSCTAARLIPGSCMVLQRQCHLLPGILRSSPAPPGTRSVIGLLLIS